MNRITRSMKINTFLMIIFKSLMIIITLLVSFCFITVTKRPEVIFLVDEAQQVDRHRCTVNHEESFTINTEGCNIPALKPLDESIMEFVRYPSTFHRCPFANNALLGNNRRYIWIRFNTFHYYKINTTDTISCCYRSFYRPAAVDDVESSRIDDRSKYSSCTRFDNIIEAKHEFVRVTCSLRKKKIYEQFFLFARIKNIKNPAHLKETISNHNETAYNVLILGIDGVSRLNFHRTMPKTADYLQRKGAIEYMGYNKVGDNTFPNIVPMLTGIKETELTKTCYPHIRATFNNCPFVWKLFKKAGYYTALGEDAPNLGVFNYVRTGFSIAPSDYYLHTFMTEAIKHVGTARDSYSFLCINNKYVYKIMLDYIEYLTWLLRKKKLFGFFWEISMSHDYLNRPMKMDKDYLKFYHRLEASGYLNKTVVILLSDHGMRWGGITYTKHGRLEERLPLLYILTPQSFRNNYKEAYNNLKLNGKRLTTPFDVYATLNDLLNLTNVEKDILDDRSSENYAEKRSISLFLPIPGSRTCQTADIDEHWCTCHEEIKLAKDNPQALKAAKAFVVLINEMLYIYPQCTVLVMSDILDVIEIKTGDWKNIMVVVKTFPGGGIF